MHLVCVLKPFAPGRYTAGYEGIPGVRKYEGIPGVRGYLVSIRGYEGI